jgi:outer membrane biosynthesis protein TonB
MRSPAAKSTTPKSKTSAKKKTTTKKSTKPKAKKPVKKAVKKKVAAKKPKKAVKKKLTPEQEERAEIKKLKEMSLLKGPTLLPETAWNVYLVDNIRGSSGSAIERAKALSTSFKNLTETEKEVDPSLP